MTHKKISGAQSESFGKDDIVVTCAAVDADDASYLPPSNEHAEDVGERDMEREQDQEDAIPTKWPEVSRTGFV